MTRFLELRVHRQVKIQYRPVVHCCCHDVSQVIPGDLILFPKGFADNPLRSAAEILIPRPQTKKS